MTLLVNVLKLHHYVRHYQDQLGNPQKDAANPGGHANLV